MSAAGQSCEQEKSYPDNSDWHEACLNVRSGKLFGVWRRKDLHWQFWLTWRISKCKIWQIILFVKKKRLVQTILSDLKHFQMYYLAHYLMREEKKSYSDNSDWPEAFPNVWSGKLFGVLLELAMIHSLIVVSSVCCSRAHMLPFSKSHV